LRPARGDRRRERLRPDAGQGHRPRRRPHRGAVPARRRARRHARAGPGDQHRLLPFPALPARGAGRGPRHRAARPHLRRLRRDARAGGGAGRGRHAPHRGPRGTRPGRAPRRSPGGVPTGWRVGARAEVWTRRDSGAGSEAVTIGLRGTPDDAEVTVTDATIGSTAEPEVSARHRARVSRDGASVRLTVDDTQQRWTVVRSPDPAAPVTFWVAGDGGTWLLRLRPLIDSRIHDAGAADGQILSPMPGSVIACFVGDGDEVTAGQNVLAVEAMKMEHALTAPIDGVVRLHVSTGDQVTADH